MTFETVYILIGVLMYLTFAVLTIIALGRFAFHCAFREYPDPDKCCILPGLALPGNRGESWLEVFFQALIFGLIPGALIITMLWPFSILLLINLIIKKSRQKRFGH